MESNNFPNTEFSYHTGGPTSDDEDNNLTIDVGTSADEITPTKQPCTSTTRTGQNISTGSNEPASQERLASRLPPVTASVQSWQGHYSNKPITITVGPSVQTTESLQRELTSIVSSLHPPQPMPPPAYQERHHNNPSMVTHANPFNVTPKTFADSMKISREVQLERRPPLQQTAQNLSMTNTAMVGLAAHRYPPHQRMTDAEMEQAWPQNAKATQGILNPNVIAASAHETSELELIALHYPAHQTVHVLEMWTLQEKYLQKIPGTYFYRQRKLHAITHTDFRALLNLHREMLIAHFNLLRDVQDKLKSAFAGSQ